MNRRDFIVGIFGVAASTVVPTTSILLEETSRDWELAVAQVLSRYFSDVICYGIGAIEPCDEFPYVRNILLQDMIIPNAGPSVPFVHDL